MKVSLNTDDLIAALDHGLRTVYGIAEAQRPYPAADHAEGLTRPEDRLAAARLMRVNHAGEVCAQALYMGQKLLARNPDTAAFMEKAAREEKDHMGWCLQRLRELDASPSRLGPLWYGGSFLLAMTAALAGDRYSYAFLTETERQVTEHLQRHLNELPPDDERSRAIVEQMAREESAHADNADNTAELPALIKFAMRQTSKILTRVAPHI